MKIGSGPADPGLSWGARLRDWGDQRLAHGASGRPGSLVLGCVLRYLECTENSAEALVLGTFLSVVPALLATYALSDLSHGAGNGIAQHLIYRLHIQQPAARLVSSAFGSETSNAAAATVLGLAGFLIFGLGLGRIAQRVYARAWRIDVGSPADRWRFALWFVACTLLLGLQVAEQGVVSFLGWVLVSPIGLAVLVTFWLWTPRLLLHGQVSLRRLLPGAVLTAAAYMIAFDGLGVRARLLDHRQRPFVRFVRRSPRPGRVGSGGRSDLAGRCGVLPGVRRMAGRVAT